MHNLARFILAVVVVFVIAVAGVLVVRSRSARVESVGPSPSSADLQIKEVDLEEDSKGVRWRLKASQALMFDKARLTQLRNLVADIYQQDRSWTIVADEGELDRATNNVEVRRNVVVTANDGLRLETAVLRWDSRDKRLWTDAAVTLTRNGSVVRGTGLDVRLAEEATTITGPVRATFVTGKPR